MFRVPFSEALAILGSVLAIVLIVLDKAGKLKGPMLLILLAVAAVLTLPLALSCPWVRDASPRMLQFSRGMLMVFLVGVVYSIIAVWISGSATPPQQDVSAPNIDCLGEDELFVELKRDIFRESETYGHGLRAVTGKFQNKPCPPKRIAAIDKVKAQISYYGFDFPDKVKHVVHHCCWLNEDSPYPLFAVDAVHQLIIGTFEPRQQQNGFKPAFTIWENNPDKSIPLLPRVYGNCRGFRIKVALNAGEHGEFGGEYDYELRIDLKQPTNSYTFEYLSEARKQEKRRETLRRFGELVKEGERFLAQHAEQAPRTQADWMRFYEQARSWRIKAETVIRDNLGLPGLGRFDNFAELKHCPNVNRGDKLIEDKFLDEIYTRLLNLQGIAREY